MTFLGNRCPGSVPFGHGEPTSLVRRNPALGRGWGKNCDANTGSATTPQRYAWRVGTPGFTRCSYCSGGIKVDDALAFGVRWS